MLDIPTNSRTIPRANAWQISARVYTGYNYSLLANKKKKKKKFTKVMTPL